MTDYHLPAHRKFGYQHAVEMREITEALQDSGLSDTEINFRAIEIYQERHKDDPTFRERQVKWLKRRPAPEPGPLSILMEAMKQIANGHNDPGRLARETLEAIENLGGEK